MSVYRNFDQESLQREYSPSSCVDDINTYLNQYATRSHAARELANTNSGCRLGLKYGASAAESLDFFAAKSERDAPLQVFVHGGYWQELSKDDSSFAAPMFLDHGAAFAAIDYTLAPNKSLTEIVAEVRLAIAWLYQNANQLGFDRKQLYVSGSSAGAHLAAMLLLTDWAQFGVPDNVVCGLCAVSGIYDLEPVRLTDVNDKVAMDPGEAQSMSPAHYPVRNPCPVILAYGDNETSEFKRQTNDYLAHLRQQNMTTTCEEIPGRNHFDVIMDLMDANSWLSRQVLQQMNLA